MKKNDNISTENNKFKLKIKHVGVCYCGKIVNCEAELLFPPLKLIIFNKLLIFLII